MRPPFLRFCARPFGNLLWSRSCRMRIIGKFPSAFTAQEHQNDPA
ncbi:hypothetical protein HMPREF3036_02465 [Sutterella sp. KLE1602]|nr:hypothetical protein HMPREF3036_02465 [Sutterella sp. KLE1602]